MKVSDHAHERSSRWVERTRPRVTRILHSGQHILQRVRWLLIFEIAAVITWAVWVSRLYLNPDPFVWPLGGDYPLTIEPLFNWKLLQECGSCMLWNGMFNGGMPMFAEAHAPILHPLVILSTLALGAINGSKLSLVISFVIAGLGQWSLARELGVGRLGRLWAAVMIVVGGELAGKMEMGLMAVVLSTAFATLAAAAVVRLARTRRTRDAVWLGIALALTYLAGQGYLQVALLASILVAVVAFGYGSGPVKRQFRLRMGLAVGLSVLLAAPFWLPLVHMLPAFGKYTDTGLAASQPLGYVPLNFVVHDYEVFRTQVLGKIGFPAMYINFIGWTPLLLAIWGGRTLIRRDKAMLGFMAGSVGMIMLMASDEWAAAMAKIWEGAAVSIRYPPLLLGMAVPFILGLAALAIDDLQNQRQWQFSLVGASGRGVRLPVIPAVLVVILVLAVRPANRFGQDLMKTSEVDWDVYSLAEKVQAKETQWVQPPPDHYWMPFLLDKGIKITNIFRPWYLKDRQPPPGRTSVEFVAPEADPAEGSVGEQGPTMVVQVDESVHYAMVQTPAGGVPCEANAMGGEIEVSCQNDLPGTLVVMENNLPGWAASRDGTRTPVLRGDWLRLDAPIGQHAYQFQYRPWDVPVGMALSLAGLIGCIVAWRRPQNPSIPATESTAVEST